MNIKTPISQLQEIMIKRSCVPEYTFLDEASAAGHFQCRVKINNITVVGDGHNKKEAKQKAAQLALEKCGHLNEVKSITGNIPPPITPVKTTLGEVDKKNVVDLLTLCNKHYAAAPEYTLIGEVGLSHLKLFTVECKSGSVTKQATGKSKKIAKQEAAGLMLEHYKDNAPESTAQAHLQRISNSTVENEQMINELAKLKYLNLDKHTRNLQPISGDVSNYHFAFVNSIEESKLGGIVELLKNYDSSTSCSVFIEKLFKKIPLQFEWSQMPSNGPVICSFHASSAQPPIFIASFGKDYSDAKKNCAKDVLSYVSLMISLGFK